MQGENCEEVKGGFPRLLKETKGVVSALRVFSEGTSPWWAGRCPQGRVPLGTVWVALACLPIDAFPLALLSSGLSSWPWIFKVDHGLTLAKQPCPCHIFVE